MRARAAFRMRALSPGSIARRAPRHPAPVQRWKRPAAQARPQFVDRRCPRHGKQLDRRSRSPLRSPRRHPAVELAFAFLANALDDVARRLFARSCGAARRHEATAFGQLLTYRPPCDRSRDRTRLSDCRSPTGTGWYPCGPGNASRTTFRCSRHLRSRAASAPTRVPTSGSHGRNRLRIQSLIGAPNPIFFGRSCRQGSGLRPPFSAGISARPPLVFHSSGMSMEKLDELVVEERNARLQRFRHADLVDAHQQQLRQPQPELAVDHAGQYIRLGKFGLSSGSKKLRTMLKLSSFRYSGSSRPAASMLAIVGHGGDAVHIDELALHESRETPSRLTRNVRGCARHGR